MDDEQFSAEIERIWQETGPPPKEVVEAVHKALAAQFAHWLEAPSFRAGFPHLLGRRSRIMRTAARLLTRETPETLAGVMNKIRPGRLTVALRRRKLPCEVTTKAAERVQAAAMMAMNVTEFDDLVRELADLIEEALVEGRPNDTDWVDAFDALWRVEVEAPRTSRKYNKDEPDFKLARKARKVLGQRIASNNPTKLKRGRPEGSGWRGRIKTLATKLLAGPPERRAAVTSRLRLPKTESTTTVAQLTRLIRQALRRKWPSERDQARGFTEIWRIGVD
jgi:hypothetical protein